jgi:hypothetical protein
MWLRASSVFAVACAFSMVFSAALIFQACDGARPEGCMRAEIFQEPGAPKAVISPLPPEVSNGTFWYLNGSGSYPGDPSHSIVNYTWEVYFRTGETTQFLYAKKEYFMFRDLGLYIITLTVRDSLGLTGTTFTAVYSILDSDSDDLPDWWEMNYFNSLNQSGSGDADGDEWTNLQEYANGLNPKEEDPRPGLVQDMKDNWYYLVIIAAVIVVAILLMLPILRRRRKEQEKKKIKAAIEIEKALEED